MDPAGPPGMAHLGLHRSDGFLELPSRQFRTQGLGKLYVVKPVFLRDYEALPDFSPFVFLFVYLPVFLN